ncbi:MAG: hypothetical protein GY906_10080 [bacterium]|nr:hypothetical protein [bacterium]
MIEEFVQTRYRCTVCSKSYVSKARTEDHIEKGCVRDPETRACKTCRHWDRWSHCAVGAKDSDEWAIRHCDEWTPYPTLEDRNGTDENNNDPV